MFAAAAGRLVPATSTLALWYSGTGHTGHQQHSGTGLHSLGILAPPDASSFPNWVILVIPATYTYSSSSSLHPYLSFFDREYYFGTLNPRALVYRANCFQHHLCTNFLPIFPLNANAMMSSICFGLRHLCLQTQQQISFCHQFTIWD